MVSLRFLARLVKAACRGSWFQAPPHTEDSLQTVFQHVQAGHAVLVDVRESSEWEESTVPGAERIPLSQILDAPSSPNIHDLLPQGKIAYLFCRAGGRCRMAAHQLRGHGHDLRPLKEGAEAIIEFVKQREQEASP
ncbi:rhodanese-like domain-containing protein [Thalassoroseus pseudoceratinae]|uniref:rhodanese-like domain-containing protein n=1 Tax=Thalassoroseus pseudoceratinae TaxID=2713176 RepID=UPI0014227F34|nr:rhodanese-like domain-containing protein [Thalassoroseus pseudoceratinae]